jgi:hypothetical protein
MTSLEGYFQRTKAIERLRHAALYLWLPFLIASLVPIVATVIKQSFKTDSNPRPAINNPPPTINNPLPTTNNPRSILKPLERFYPPADAVVSDLRNNIGGPHEPHVLIRYVYDWDKLRQHTESIDSRIWGLDNKIAQDRQMIDAWANTAEHIRLLADLVSNQETLCQATSEQLLAVNGHEPLDLVGVRRRVELCAKQSGVVHEEIMTLLTYMDHLQKNIDDVDQLVDLHEMEKDELPHIYMKKALAQLIEMEIRSINEQVASIQRAYDPPIPMIERERK